VTDTDRLNILKTELVRLQQQLRLWAAKSIKGGWSTHQVDPMRAKADEIDDLLERIR
jgi:hypothetical protein